MLEFLAASFPGHGLLRHRAKDSPCQDLMTRVICFGEKHRFRCSSDCLSLPQCLQNFERRFLPFNISTSRRPGPRLLETVPLVSCLYPGVSSLGPLPDQQAHKEALGLE